MTDRRITIPDLCLVVLVGVSGSGKSTFAARSTSCRPRSCRRTSAAALVADDENDQTATDAAFDVLHSIVAKRLESGKLDVIDATNVQRDAPQAARSRSPASTTCLPVAIVLDVPRRGLPRTQRTPTRPRLRPARRPQPAQRAPPIDEAASSARASAARLRLSGADEIDAATVEREPLLDRPTRRSRAVRHHRRRPRLRRRAGRAARPSSAGTSRPTGSGARHPDGRDGRLRRRPRRPRPGDARRAAPRRWTWSTPATRSCIPGNHENKLQRALAGRNVQVSHGLAESLEQLAAEPPEFRDAGRGRSSTASSATPCSTTATLVVAHAGLPEDMHNRQSGAVRSFALYGDTTGETDEYGLPVRYPWAEDYRGKRRRRLRPHAGARRRRG